VALLFTIICLSYFFRRFSCRIARLRSLPAIHQPPPPLVDNHHPSPPSPAAANSPLQPVCLLKVVSIRSTHTHSHTTHPPPSDFYRSFIHARAILPWYSIHNSNLPNRSSLARIGDEASLTSLCSLLSLPPFHYGRSNPVVAAADRPVPTRG
jgi:hypothetical protein